MQLCELYSSQWTDSDMEIHGQEVSGGVFSGLTSVRCERIRPGADVELQCSCDRDLNPPSQGALELGWLLKVVSRWSKGSYLHTPHPLYTLTSHWKHTAPGREHNPGWGSCLAEASAWRGTQSRAVSQEQFQQLREWMLQSRSGYFWAPTPHPPREPMD